ncbi:bZIP transcription factor 27-like [Salvia splendens]|uniref:bZIP transcription factor 27-like n=1 Tax=Salvia splendens TaxID=180675 RepID=UPI001C279A06|nr:bZIP transcription factor 27-like [Salvia splendens]
MGIAPNIDRNVASEIVLEMWTSSSDPKTMEQVWKDITLAPSHLHLTTAAAGKKRLQGFDITSADDRHHKRMIKNRESAARSRARKQAYTTELELEVAHLLQENAMLRKQQLQFYREEAAAVHKRKPLHRASTAPF